MLSGAQTAATDDANTRHRPSRAATATPADTSARRPTYDLANAKDKDGNVVAPTFVGVTDKVDDPAHDRGQRGRRQHDRAAWRTSSPTDKVNVRATSPSARRAARRRLRAGADERRGREVGAHLARPGRSDRLGQQQEVRAVGPAAPRGGRSLSMLRRPWPGPGPTSSSRTAPSPAAEPEPERGGATRRLLQPPAREPLEDARGARRRAPGQRLPDPRQRGVGAARGDADLRRRGGEGHGADRRDASRPRPTAASWPGGEALGAQAAGAARRRPPGPARTGSTCGRAPP